MSTIIRDPAVTARIRAAKAVIKREAEDQRLRRDLLSKPHREDVWNLMYQKDVHRILISALLDIYLVMRGKPAAHLPKNTNVWRKERVIASANALIEAELSAQAVSAV